MSRPPTAKQYSTLLGLANPGRLLVSGIRGNRRLWKSLLSHGWVVAEKPERDPHNGLHITPDGLRALAAGLEQFGYPDPYAEVSRKEPRQIQELRATRDEAREQAADAQREVRRLRFSLSRITAVVGDEVDRAV